MLKKVVYARNIGDLSDDFFQGLVVASLYHLKSMISALGKSFD